MHDLYYAPNFTFSSKFHLWDPKTDCCSWEGVTCDAIGHVIGLDLSYKNLSGSFPSIFGLHRLQRLNLAGNNFNTTLLSYEFDKLANLTHLNLSSSCFHGQIPMEISYLTRLVSLDMSNQEDCYRRYYKIPNPYIGVYFDDPLPSELKKSIKLKDPSFETLIKNLNFLREIYLDFVDISSQSSKWCETTFLALSNLQVLSLSNCGLEGPLCSSLSALPFLSKLILDSNPITSLPPNFLKNSSHLVSLSMAYCSLSGLFPTEILLLPKIQSVDLFYNERLEGQLPEFSSNNVLKSLSLSYTNFSGKLPESIGNLNSLRDLTLSGCNFFGSIPWSIANLSHLVNLGLSANHFSGSIPSSLFSLPSLRELSLNWNQLVGKIDEFSNASSSLIEELGLGNNYLTGPIPKSLLQLKNLRDLDLSNMSLLIESDKGSLTDFSKLESLRLRSCNLTEFPEFIKTQDKLTFLDLANNHIHGVVPNWLWKASLVWVDLSFNPIDFPKQLPSGDASFSHLTLGELNLESCNISVFPEVLKSSENLERLDLSNNRISGAIPNWVWKKRLRYLNLSQNHFSSLDQLLSNHSSTSSQASLPSYVCSMSRLYEFDASHNNLNGPIPNCLCNMSQLWNFDISHNNLSGPIPNCLENMSQLDTFDVSHNNLSGPIPNCLGNMSALISLNLQGNSLSGILPEFSKVNQLRFLKVGENRLRGKLPRSFAGCTQLQVLDVGNNIMHDTFPFWLKKLPYLAVLILRENRFYGQIKHLNHKIGFPALDVLDITSNQFSGELSIDFLQATQLRSLKIGGNNLEGKLSSS
ncbi:hypothetical protein V6N13_054769 [Hibiscus sabdariffa]